jgi:hypothetical protein
MTAAPQSSQPSIVERLRDMAGKPYKEANRPVLSRAADRIEALEAALREIAKIKARHVADGFETGPQAHFDQAKRIAREALAVNSQDRG